MQETRPVNMNQREFITDEDSLNRQVDPQREMDNEAGLKDSIYKGQKNGFPFV